MRSTNEAQNRQRGRRGHSRRGLPTSPRAAVTERGGWRLSRVGGGGGGGGTMGGAQLIRCTWSPVGHRLRLLAEGSQQSAVELFGIPG